MSIPTVPLRTWILLGSLVGTPTISLCFLAYFYVTLTTENVPLGSLTILRSYLQLIVVCLLPTIAVAASVGLISTWRRTAGDRDIRFTLFGAGGVAMLPAVVLLLVALSEKLSVGQALNILLTFGLLPAAVAIGTSVLTFHIAARKVPR